jgi:hypothetical protein
MNGLYKRSSLRNRLILLAVFAALSVGFFQLAAPIPAQASWVAFSGYRYGWDPGSHWYVEYNVSPLRAHEYQWHSTGPLGACDDWSNGKPYCSTWGAVNDISSDNLVRSGVRSPDWLNPWFLYGSPSNFYAYP